MMATLGHRRARGRAGCAIGVASLAVLATGCVGDEVKPEGRVHKYVIRGVTMPNNPQLAGELGLLRNSSNSVINTFGRALAGRLPLEHYTRISIEHGNQMQLVEFQATNFEFAVSAGVTTHYAFSSTPEPCFIDSCGRHLDGNAEFDLSFDAPQPMLLGHIDDGTFVSEPGTQSIALSIDGIMSFKLPLLSAQLQLKRVTEDGIGEGVISGAIPLSLLSGEFVDHIVFGSLDVLAECDSFDGCNCPSGSAAEMFQRAFGDAGSCVVSETDVRASAAMTALLHSDISVDGVDAVSFGIGFTAVRASY
ncbi:MAG: hypothetical protein AB7L28_15865 [Kofleriaceae bacterium]